MGSTLRAPPLPAADAVQGRSAAGSKELKQRAPAASALSAPARRLAGPKRLAAYAPADLPAAAREVARGASLASVWRRYAATATITPIGYVAFTKQVKRWHAQSRIPEIAPGLSDYTPAEGGTADRYWADRSDPSSSIHVLAGFGCSLKVEHGLLTTFDTGTIRKFEPINHRLSAIVFTGASGLVTIDAIKWCEAKGVGIFVLDWLGDLVSVTLPIAPDNVSIRRAQFAADPLVMARAILRQKIAAALRIGKLSERSVGIICGKIRAARSIDTLLMIEAKAAIDYWRQWKFPAQVPAPRVATVVVRIYAPREPHNGKSTARSAPGQCNSELRLWHRRRYVRSIANLSRS